MHPPGVVKKILWALALAVFLLSMIGAKVVARPGEEKMAPTPFDSFNTITVLTL